MITATNPPRFLIIQTAFIGDVILATALLEQLHQHRPHAQIDILVRKGNEDLLAGHPFVHEVLVWDKKGGGKTWGKYRNLRTLLRIIRKRRYDAVLNVQRFGATGLLTAFSGAPIRVGFSKNPLARFFTHRIEHRIQPTVHEIDRNAELLKPLGLTGKPARPRLYPSVAQYDAVRTYQQTPYVCIAPTSVWFTKQFPAQRWVELIQQLPTTLTVYLLGAPADAPTCDSILALAGRSESGEAGRGINLAGRLSLLESAALMQGALMNYVNDSAPLHLCSAMNAPTTAVFCSTVPEFGFGPLADVAQVVQTPELLDCRPCNLHGQSECPLEHFRCAWSIELPEPPGQAT